MTKKYFQPYFIPKWQPCGDNYLLYANVYKTAVKDLLYNLQNHSGHNHDYQNIPLLYLFRHYIELQLTGLILYGSIISDNLSENIDEFIEKARKTHNLMMLLNKLKEVEIPNKYWNKTVTTFITNLDKLDKKSDRFRYPENSNGQIFYGPDDPIYKTNPMFFVDLNKLDVLAADIDNVIQFLEGMETYFDIQKENYEESIQYDQDNYNDAYSSDY